jgi:hypothetical protein
MCCTGSRIIWVIDGTAADIELIQAKLGLIFWINLESASISGGATPSHEFRLSPFIKLPHKLSRLQQLKGGVTLGPTGSSFSGQWHVR